MYTAISTILLFVCLITFGGVNILKDARYFLTVLFIPAFGANLTPLIFQEWLHGIAFIGSYIYLAVLASTYFFSFPEEQRNRFLKWFGLIEVVVIGTTAYLLSVVA